MNTTQKSVSQPFAPKTVTLFLVVIIVILAIFSGYFHARYTNEEKKYARLLLRYQSLKEEYATSSAQPVNQQ